MTSFVFSRSDIYLVSKTPIAVAIVAIIAIIAIAIIAISPSS